MKRYITSRENAPVAVFTMAGTEKKCMIWHFGLSRSQRKKFLRDFGT